MNQIDLEQDRIIEEIASLDDWTDVYQYLISAGRSLDASEEGLRKQENLISGCQSQLWLTSEFRDGKVFYHTDSDALITKGILALLMRVLNGRKPQEIVNTELYFIEKTGISEHLSPVRSNGLAQVLVHLREHAMRYV